MPDLDDVIFDLSSESEALDEIVEHLSDAEWQTPTPAEGWTIATQIAHLAWTDDVATAAATDAERFASVLDEAVRSPSTFIDDGAAAWSQHPPAELLRLWRAGRRALTTALIAVPPGEKVPWFGPPMSPMSMVTARLMESWAHAQDVADALGRRCTPTDRLRHVAHLGVRTRDFAFRTRGFAPPGEEFRIELVGPTGSLWTWGPTSATQQVAGPALDFCLLVTQRRHRSDLSVVAIGDDANTWLDVAQAFAGPPGPGRPATG